MMRYLLFFLLFILILSCKEESSAIQNIQRLSDDERNVKLEEFGKTLFFDMRLSMNNKVSCGSCHKPEFAFADTNSISPGVEGRLGFRNAPSLINVGDKPLLMLDGAVPSLEMQAIVPIQDHNEMSISMGDLVKKLNKIREYNDLSHLLFQKDIDSFVITRALRAYERTLMAGKSTFDHYIKDPVNYPLSDGELLGWRLFQEKRCIECHSLPNFTNNKLSVSGFEMDPNDLGRYRITGDSNDRGKFVVPSLRNISITYPYLHNGSMHSLNELILHHYININKQTGESYPSVNQEDADFITRFLISLKSLD